MAKEIVEKKPKSSVSDFLAGFEKDINKIEGVSTSSTPPRYWVGFGNYAINRVMSGSFKKGIPQGRITALCGPSSAGKSFLAGNLCRQAQAEGSIILVVDSENALDDTFMGNIGVDTDNDYFYVSPDTIAQATKVVNNFITRYKEQYGEAEDAPRVLILVDSLDMLMTDAEKEASTKGAVQFDQGQHSRMLKSMLRTWVQDIKTLNISIVVTKQVYRARQDQLLQGEGTWVVNDAIRYACSQILLATRLKLKSEDKKAGKAADVVGIRLKAEGFKTRFASPFSVVSVEVPYSSGMNPYSGLFEVACALGIVIQQGSWYILAGDDTKYRRADIEENMMDKVLELCEQSTQSKIDVESLLDEEYVEDTGHQTVRTRSPAPLQQ